MAAITLKMTPFCGGWHTIANLNRNKKIILVGGSSAHLALSFPMPPKPSDPRLQALLAIIWCLCLQISQCFFATLNMIWGRGGGQVWDYFPKQVCCCETLLYGKSPQWIKQQITPAHERWALCINLLVAILGQMSMDIIFFLESMTH